MKYIYIYIYIYILRGMTLGMIGNREYLYNVTIYLNTTMIYYNNSLYVI